jgi:hypothetical protein
MKNRCWRSIEAHYGLLASGRWRPFRAHSSGTPKNNGHMSDILIYCAVTGQPVPTGLDTETVIFESLPNVEIPVKCPSCGEMHRWRPRDAWVAIAGNQTRH